MKKSSHAFAALFAASAILFSSCTKKTAVQEPAGTRTIVDQVGNTVTLPCFDVQYVEGKGIVVMAHRTGRPVA